MNWVALGGLLLLTSTASAQSLNMLAVTDFVAAGPKPQVIGANPADAAKWPATFVFKNAEGGGCTATAVGRLVLVTAAHCVEDGAKGSASIGTLTVNVLCNRHPAYPADISADFSLCVLDKSLPKVGSGFERVNATETAAPPVAQDVTLLGYGCITVGGVDRSFGTLYEGTAKVALRLDKNLYLVTKGGAAVCFGDSGGGAYYWNLAGTTRRLFGVNSRGDISQNSWISTTANKSFLDWASGWARDRSVRICGLDGSAEDCQQ